MNQKSIWLNSIKSSNKLLKVINNLSVKGTEPEADLTFDIIDNFIK